MSKFYFKNKNGEFIPIELRSIINKDLSNKLTIIRVGTDDHQASMSDVDETEESFAQADVLNDIDNASLIITPYQIDINYIDNEEREGRTLYLQITNGEDIGMLDKKMQSLYKKLSKKFKNITVLPSPLKLRDYNQFVATLQRCDMRKKRRNQNQL